MIGVGDPPTFAAYYRAMQAQQEEAQRIIAAQMQRNAYADLYKYYVLADPLLAPAPEPAKPKEPEDPAAARFTKLELD